MSDPSENPFEGHVEHGLHHYRKVLDVSSLNEHITSALAESIERLRGQQQTDQRQKIQVVVGAPGYGKTHLFGRVGHSLPKDVFFVFVPHIEDPEHPLDHIRRHTVESLFRIIDADSPSPIENLLSTLCHKSFEEYFDMLPQDVSTNLSQLIERIRCDHVAVLDIVTHVREMEPFLRLADSIAEAREHEPLPNAVVRALVLCWSPARRAARRWLRGESISGEQLKALHLCEEPPTATDVLRSISTLMRHQWPIVICCDQLDVVLHQDHTRKIFADHMVRLLHEISNLQLVVSCLKDSWNLLKSEQMFVHRSAKLQLEHLNEDQAVELVRLRLSIAKRPNQHSGIHPFEEESLRAFVRKNQVHPRGLLMECCAAYDSWLNNADPSVVIRLGQKTDVRPPLEDLFLRAWNEAISAIHNDVVCTPENTDIARVYRGIREALDIVRNTTDWTMRGHRIDQVEEDLIPQTQTGNPRRYSLGVKLRKGKSAYSVLISPTDLENSSRFVYYFNALRNVIIHPMQFAVMVFPRQDVPAGGKNAATRMRLNKLVDQGRLKLFSLIDNRDTFETLECLLRLRDRAAHEDLILDRHRISLEDFDKFVATLGLLDHLPLLDHIFAPIPQEAQDASSKDPPAADALIVQLPTPAVDSTQTAKVEAVAQADLAPATLETKAKPKKCANVVEWACVCQSEVVKQLANFGIKVEPAKVQVGARFARLMVRPLGSTTISQVRRKAEDLKTRLKGVSSNPIVDSQADGFSIDVALPTEFRRIVTMGDMMEHAPEKKRDSPLFPLGQDVAGQAHWAGFFTIQQRALSCRRNDWQR